MNCEHNNPKTVHNDVRFDDYGPQSVYNDLPKS